MLNPSHSWAPNIAGLWLPGTNGRTGYTLRDLSGRHNHGTLTGSPTWNSRSHVGGFSSLNIPEGSYVDLGTGNVMPITTEATWILWHNAADLNGGLWTMDNNNFDTWSQVGTGGAGKIRFGIENDAGVRTFFDTTSAISANVWSLIIYRWLGTEMSVWFGTESQPMTKDATTGTLTGTLNETGNPKYLGSVGGGTAAGLYGGFFTMNRGLRDHEIEAFRQESLRGYPTLLNWYRPKRTNFFEAGGGGGPVWKPLSLLGVG